MRVIATAGHVNHGKSTLVQTLTGRDPDRLPEERRRGLTVDLGFASTRLPGGELAFVDVPGHHRFISNTLSGIATAPAVLLVVAADGGWEAQSEEHLAAIDAFGVRHGLIAVTRSDLRDPGPVLRDAVGRVRRTSLGAVEAVPVSARTGAGIDRLRALLDGLVTNMPSADDAVPVRLWIDRAFSMSGAGTVVTGTLSEGTLHCGMTLVVSGTGEETSIRGLQCLGRAVESISGPARVAVNLRRTPLSRVGRGFALVEAGGSWRTTTIDVRVVDAERLPVDVMLHCGTAAIPARARRLADDLHRLAFATPLPLRLGDRLLIRDTGRRTFLPATVLEVEPPPLRRRGSAAAWAETLRSTARPGDLLRRRGIARRTDLAAMGAPPPEEAIEYGQWLLDPKHARHLESALAAAVTDHDRARPSEPGLPPAEAARILDLPDDALVAVLTARTLVIRDGRVHDPRRPTLAPGALAVIAELTELAASVPFHAPTARRITELGATHQLLAHAVWAAALWGGDGIYLLPDAPARAVEILRTIDEPFSVSDCCRALDTSRRVAIPLLEHLDATRATVREPDGRRRLTEH